MGYPEEEITFCPYCREEIPPACYWRGGGVVVSNGGREVRTVVLHSICPTCGEEQCSGLEGWLPYRWFYAWLWRLRYPATSRPRLTFAWVRLDEERAARSEERPAPAQPERRAA
jgi:hypothetical protein